MLQAARQEAKKSSAFCVLFFLDWSRCPCNPAKAPLKPNPTPSYASVAKPVTAATVATAAAATQLTILRRFINIQLHLIGPDNARLIDEFINWPKRVGEREKEG